MSELHHIYSLQKKYVFFLLAFCALGWGFTPYSTVFAGIALGVFFSTCSFWILVRRMDKFDRSISEGKKIRSLGTTQRYALAILAVGIAMTKPEYFHLISTVIGLSIPYVLLLISKFVSHVKQH